MSRRINLLPPEIAARRRVRQQTTAAVAAGVALLMVLGLFYVVQVGRLGTERKNLARQQSVNAGLEAKVRDLNEFDQLAKELAAKTKLIDGLTVAEVRWSIVLSDLSLIIPSNAWLTNLTATVNVAAVSAGPTGNQRVTLGKVDLTGVTFTHLDVAKWLVRLAGVDGFTFPYLSLSVRSSIGLTPTVDFTSSVELAEPAFRRNQPGAERVR
jgi:Tfp pilus assembly protein PilN